MEMYELPDGSGFFTASMPLPNDHWIYTGNQPDPPAPFQCGTEEGFCQPYLGTRQQWKEKIIEAAQYAIRGATMRGKDMNFDPDALVQNLIIGLLGYNTPDGRSEL